MTSPPSSSSHLRRELRLRDIIALGINGVIGTGIFFLPGEAAAMLGPAAVIPFLLSALLCSQLVFCFAESLDPGAAKNGNFSIKKWDFLFYALFGVVVTQSVAIAGVLVVFSFLVIPAVIAFLFTESPPKLLAIAWGSGTIAVILGLVVSFKSDLPTGPVVVCAFALVLVVAFGVRALLQGGKELGLS